MDDLKIPKLDGNNYTAWSIRTRAALVQRNCWEAIDPGYGLELSDEERKTNEKALTFLFLVVEDSFLDDIADCTTAKDAWTSLKDIHTKFGLLHTLQLLREFFNIKMNPTENMSSYLGRIMELHRKVSSCGYGFTDREVSLVMLMGLPKEYENLILNLERDEGGLSTKTVKSRLIVEEKKLLRYSSESEQGAIGERALKTKDSAKLRGFDAPKKHIRDHERRTRCFSCGDWGHIARKCPVSKTVLHNKKVPSDAHQALFTDSCGDKSLCDWYLDSGATEHMCSQREKFTDLVPIKTQVEIANSEKIEAIGTGNIIFRPAEECGTETISLAKVLYVPNLDSNLLSVGRIEDMGMTISFQKGKAIIRNPNQQNKIILTAHKCGRLYKIKERLLYKAHISKHEELMHRRLGHFHKSAVKKLVEKNDSYEDHGEISKESDTCSTCILGKMKKIPFPISESKHSSRLLELVHTDVSGPITPISKGGSKYIITFIDDYSRYVVVKPMKSKDQAFEKFIEYKNNVENLHGLKITSLRSDNGGEYTSEKFVDFLKENGISRQLTVPRTPQQNGVAERMNHTLFDMTRCLLFDSNIPNELWADAITTACYLRNKCPSQSIQERIPEELWFQKPIETGNLKIFGCKAYAQIDKARQEGKLGKRAQECVLIGYPEGIKGYKLWNVEKDKFFISRNVKFDETVFPFRRSQTEKKVELNFRPNDKVPEVSVIPSEILDDITTEVESTEQSLEDPDLDQPTSTEESPEVRRSNRVRKPKTYFGDPILYKVVSEQVSSENIEDPTTLEEAMKSPHAEMWKEAMKEELNNLHRNQTWELIPKPANTKPIGCKWVFKRKLNTEGKVIKFKARLVAKGYSQIPGKDFSETFSPVVKIKSIRILLALAVELDMKVHQMDITSAYLNGTLKEDIYMLQPEGTQQQGKEHLVCHLKRSLYGLRQAGREWNECFDNFLKEFGLLRSRSDPCIYYDPKKTLYLGIYVDDMLIVGTPETINTFKNRVMQKFQAKDLGEANEILSMRIQRLADGSITLDQTAYIEEILEIFKASSLKGASTPLDPSVKHYKINDAEWNTIKEQSAKIPYRQAIGSLLYLACGTRPDIAFSSTYMSQFNERPLELHWRSVKHIFRYLKETKHLSLVFRKTGRAVESFSDADWGADHIDRKSISGYVIIFGGAAVSWSSKKQCCTALSSAESEYVALAHSTKEVLWMKSLMQELCMERFIPTPILLKTDSQAAMFIAKNQTTSDRSKHIDIRHHFLRDHIDRKVICLEHISSAKNVADLLTKNISKKVLINLRKYLGLSYGYPI